MGLKSRRLGQTYEREALKLLQDAGLNARRSAASGAQEGYVADIELEAHKRLDIEVKYSSEDRGMGVIRRYLHPVDMVWSRAPGEAWIVTMDASLAIRLLQDSGNLRKVIRGQDNG
jgi:Holliday junction resolvase